VAGTASLPEVAGDAALRFDPDDVETLAQQLQTVLADSALRAELGIRGQQRAAGFTWAATAAATLAVYQSLP
jgi:glycosyltransferase involved in cell wall biosynthesis